MQKVAARQLDQEIKKLQAVFVNPGSHAILRVKLHALNCMANCMQFNAYNWP
jgi:hypothetical protein